MNDQSNRRPWLSVIIPAHNEEGYLPRLLDSVDKASANYRGGAAQIEVIVADNASTDRTGLLARLRGCRVVMEPKRNIAAVRNAGAAIAQGKVLAFVDADMQVHPETFNLIEEALANPRVIGGSTGVKLEHVSLGSGLTYALIVPLTWLTGIDIGVAYCRSDDFFAVGGYSERRFFAEDAQFLYDLKHLGRRRQQGLKRLTPVKAVFSTRKFELYGQWHYFVLIARIVYGTLMSRSCLEKYVRPYWYGQPSGKRQTSAILPNVNPKTQTSNLNT
jgi:glycosyltransferase involved in cell wall biosynthesis